MIGGGKELVNFVAPGLLNLIPTVLDRVYVYFGIDLVNNTFD